MTDKKLNPIELLESMTVPLDNPYFTILHNTQDDAYDMILNEPGYEVNDMFLDVLGLIHLIGQKCVEELRIGYKVEEEKKVVVDKPKIFV